MNLYRAVYRSGLPPSTQDRATAPVARRMETGAIDAKSAGVSFGVPGPARPGGLPMDDPRNHCIAA